MGWVGSFQDALALPHLNRGGNSRLSRGKLCNERRTPYTVGLTAGRQAYTRRLRSRTSRFKRSIDGVGLE